MNNYFAKEIVGQTKLKSVVSFYLDSYQKTKIFHPIITYAQKGYGKTTINRIIGKQLNKRFIEVNGASLQKLDSFIEKIIIPYCKDQDITLFIDEVASIGPKISEWLLSVLQFNDNNKSIAKHNDEELEFDLRRFTFLSATTNCEKLPLPFLNRLKKLEFEQYNYNNLAEILKNHSKNIRYLENVDADISTVTRGSPRTTSLLAKDIIKYCNLYNKSSFGKKEWQDLREILGILPLGISNIELQLLKYLAERGPQTLRSIAGKLGLAVQTVSRDIELYLVSSGLVKIDVKREITVHGRNVLNACN